MIIASARQRAAMRQITEQPTRITGALKPTRLVNTDSIPVTVVEQPTSPVVPIGYVQPALLEITPMSRNIILSALRMACQNRHVVYKNITYRIGEIWPDRTRPGSFLARLERIEEDA